MCAVGCVQANASSGVAALTTELMREEIAHLTALINQLRSLGESPQCPLINLGNARPIAPAAMFSAQT